MAADRCVLDGHRSQALGCAVDRRGQAGWARPDDREIERLLCLGGEIEAERSSDIPWGRACEDRRTDDHGRLVAVHAPEPRRDVILHPTSAVDEPMRKSAAAGELQQPHGLGIRLAPDDDECALAPFDQQTPPRGERGHHGVADLRDRRHELSQSCLRNHDHVRGLPGDSRKERVLAGQHPELTDEVGRVEGGDDTLIRAIDDLYRSTEDLDEVVAVLTDFEEDMPLVDVLLDSDLAKQIDLRRGEARVGEPLEIRAWSG